MSPSSDDRTLAPACDVFAPQEFPFTRGDFRRIVDMLQQDAGIALQEIKAPLVYSRLVRRLRELGIESFRKYCELVEVQDGAAERERMVAALTTNVTRFFREPHHFKHLKLRVLPELLEQVRRGANLRIWSAGCSSGEEPYSIALTVLSVMRDATKFDVRILATDINATVLEQARAGVYQEAALAPLSRQQRADWFVPIRSPNGDKSWRAGEDLRELVAFRELNLMAEWPMKQVYQAIFCRNVMIYFAENIRTHLGKRLTGLLAPLGCLYLGHSERVSETNRFRLEGNTVYRLTAGARH